jgi:hypothetical protein
MGAMAEHKRRPESLTTSRILEEAPWKVNLRSAPNNLLEPL